jgi:hypothetical protein
MFYVALTSHTPPDGEFSKAFQGQAKGNEASSWLFDWEMVVCMMMGNPMVRAP